MSSRTNPPHDRVSLSPDERRKLNRLEIAFEAKSYSRRKAAMARRVGRIRACLARAWSRTTDRCVLVVAVGVALLLSAFAPLALLVSIAAVVLAIGVVATVHGPSVRVRRMQRRARRR